MNEKFRIDLKAASPEQSREWIAIIEAKRSLYNLDRLTSYISSREFQTKTFESVLVLKETEQVTVYDERIHLR